jgi:hypothetical protein
MASTNFVDFSTPIVAAWLNDINSFFYSLFGGATTPSLARAAIDAMSATNPSISNSLTFTGVTKTITGDFTSSLSGTLLFTTNVLNGSTFIGMTPNGTADYSVFYAFSSPAVNNAAYSSLGINRGISLASLNVGANGAGPQYPFAIQVNTQNRFYIGTNGNTQIGPAITGNDFGAALRVHGDLSCGVNINLGQGVVSAEGGQINFYGPDGTTPQGVIDTVPTGFLRFQANNSAAILTAGLQRFTIDAAGRVGIGSNPSPWTGMAASLDIGNMGLTPWQVGLPAATIANNLYNGASGWITKIAGPGQLYQMENTGKHLWFSSASVGAGAVATPLESMRINEFRNLEVGGQSGNQNVRSFFKSSDSTGNTFAFASARGDGSVILNCRGDGGIVFGNGPGAPYSQTSGSPANAVLGPSGEFFRSTSSLRYKRDVALYTRGVADLLKLEAITFKDKIYEDREPNEIVYAGFTAEGVHEAGFPEFVLYDAEDRPDAVHYANMVALLVNAIKELDARVAVLEAK